MRKRVVPDDGASAAPSRPPHATVFYLGTLSERVNSLAHELAAQGIELLAGNEAAAIAPNASVIIVARSNEAPLVPAQLASSISTEGAASGLIVVDDDWTPSKRLEALRSGCDHCLSANIEVEEFAAIVARLVHKVQPAPATLSWGPIRLDFVRGVIFIGGDRVEVQPLQLRILGLLMIHAGRVVSHEQLLDCVFRARPASASGSIARQISILRHQLGPARGLLVTVPGGYCLRERALPETPPAAACG